MVEDGFGNSICDSCKYNNKKAGEKPCNTCINYDDEGRLCADNYESAGYEFKERGCNLFQ